jgi:hypothetical protein
MLILSGDGQQGFEMLQQALGLYEQIGSLSDQANIYFLLGQIVAANGRINEALPLIENAVTLGMRIDPAHPVTQHMQSVLKDLRDKAQGTTSAPAANS